MAVITLVGAGGKTTCMVSLARDFRDAGENVLVTTTTAIYKPEIEFVDRLWIEADERVPLEEKNTVKGITVWSDRITEEEKL